MLCYVASCPVALRWFGLVVGSAYLFARFLVLVCPLPSVGLPTS